MTVTTAVVLFVVATAVVAVVGPRLTAVTGALARRTPLGRNLAGALLLGASTSLSGIVVTVTAAVNGDVALAAANAVGGVAAQTTFLAVADAAYRQGSLTRAAVSPTVLSQLGLVFALLAVPLFAANGYPDLALADRVHPASVVLVVGYVVGMWVANRQGGTASGGGDDHGDHRHDDVSTPALWGRYLGYLVLVGAAGYVLATSVGPIADALGLTSVAAGALLTAGATSSPELITALAAGRRGQPQLAVGDIVGGNTFDMVFLALADLAVAGSLYAEVGDAFVLLVSIAVLLNAVLLLGFVRDRTEHRVSPPSVAMLVLYTGLAVLLVAAPPAAGG